MRKTKPSYIMLPEMSEYIKCFDENKYKYFLIKN